MFLNDFLYLIVPYVVAGLELLGVTFIIIGTIHALYRLIKRANDFEARHVKLILSEYLTVSLDFLLAAEILHTITVGSLKDFVLIASITIIRIILTALLHWEISMLEREDKSRETIEKDHSDLREAKAKESTISKE